MSDQPASAAAPASSGGPLDIRRVMAALPHRYPMLLVDRVEELLPDRSIAAIKAVTINEGFFAGHFPGRPIMPGVLIVEALAQAGAVLLLSDESTRGQIPLFAGIEKCRFRQQVVPGDTLTLEMDVLARRGPVGKGRAVARVNDKVVAECELTFALTKMPATVSGT
jgi:3-hydroxyacyl-[acyl-carrier-protein] dehydratase